MEEEKAKERKGEEEKFLLKGIVSEKDQREEGVEENVQKVVKSKGNGSDSLFLCIL